MKLSVFTQKFVWPKTRIRCTVRIKFLVSWDTLYTVWTYKFCKAKIAYFLSFLLFFFSLQYSCHFCLPFLNGAKIDRWEFTSHLSLLKIISTLCTKQWEEEKENTENANLQYPVLIWNWSHVHVSFKISKVAIQKVHFYGYQCTCFFIFSKHFLNNVNVVWCSLISKKFSTTFFSAFSASWKYFGNLL